MDETTLKVLGQAARSMAETTDGGFTEAEKRAVIEKAFPEPPLDFPKPSQEQATIVMGQREGASFWITPRLDPADPVVQDILKRLELLEARAGAILDLLVQEKGSLIYRTQGGANG